MNKMVISNLAHRPVRSVISIVAIAVEVTLILVIVGLSLGILNDAKTRQKGVGADLMVQPPGASALGQISGAPASVRIADKIRELPHVAAVTPVVTQLNTSGALEVIYGIDLPSFEAVGGRLRYLEGGPFKNANDVMVDDYLAQSKRLKTGSTIEVLNQKFTVSGVVEHGRGGRKFIPITTMQELMGAQGKASIFYVKAGDPANAEAIVASIKAIPGMEQYTIRTMSEWMSLMTPDNVPGFSTFINVVIGVAVIIGFIVIFQAMYTAVLERTREIGILKSMGASKGYITNVILRETALLAVLGILLGIAISALTQQQLVHAFPTIRVELSGRWILNATLIAFFGSLLGAAYPAIKAAQKDPIDALAYE